MKKDIFFVVLFIFSSSFIYSQCNQNIPSNTLVLDQPGLNVIGPGQSLYWWLCSEIQLDVEGALNTVYVEDSCFLVTIVSQQGFSANFNTIYIKSPGKITSHSDSNTIYYETGVTTVENGQGNTFIECPVLTFNYNDAPVNGCDTSAIVNTAIASHNLSSFALYPNPINGEFTIELGEFHSEILLIVINPMGQVISRSEYQNTSDIQQKINGSSGIYLIRVITDDGKSASIRVLKE